MVSMARQQETANYQRVTGYQFAVTWRFFGLSGAIFLAIFHAVLYIPAHPP
jgi:hypothetical protein